MLGGDIKLIVQPGFGSLMQDLARHPLDEANAKLGTSATKTPPAETPRLEPDGARFLQGMLPLPDATMPRVPETDRRTRSLADIREAFTAFEDASDETGDVPTALRAQVPARDQAANRAAQARAEPDARLLQGQAPLTSGSRAHNQSDETASIRLRSATGGPRNPFLDSLQASAAASTRARTPASSQPFLLIFAGAVIAFALGWMTFRFF